MWVGLNFHGGLTSKFYGSTVKLRQCKKMMAIVTASNSPYKSGEFPSGTNWEDYIKWCLAEMKRVVDNEKVGMVASPAPVDTAMSVGTDNASVPPPDAPLAVDSVTGGTNDVNELVLLATGDTANNVDDTDDELDGKFVKGFLTWCLFGHIPITNDPDMRYMSFTETKVPTSYGRKTSSRSALKEAAASLDGIPVDNRRGTKRQKRGSPKDYNDDGSPSYGGPDDDTAASTSLLYAEDDGILKQALDYLDGESLEKA